MLELQVASKDITNGVLSVAWCVDAELLKSLSDEGVKDPQVVFVVAPSGSAYESSKEYRKVVPLKDLMTFLEVRASGPNKVFAFVSRRTPRDARDAVLSRQGNRYSRSILNYDGSNFSDQDATYDATPVEVVVPTGVFAKEPPQWEKAWVNYWFRSKPMDQCDYRRRRLLAYTVKPVITLLDLTARAILLLLSTLWLSRGMSLKYLFGPLAYDIGDSTEVLQGGSYAIPILPEESGGVYNRDISVLGIISFLVRKVWKVPFTPIGLFVLWVLHITHLLTAFAIAVVVLALALSLILFFASGFIGRVWDDINAWLAARKAQEEMPWYLDQEEMDLITCNPDIKNRTSLKGLPAKRRTIRLRFQDLKSRMCRPFSA